MNHRWGIIGLGNIAHQFVQDLALIPHAVLYAVASRSRQKATDFATKYQALKAYDSYDQLLEDPEVTVVYIATPHDSHAELSIRAMRHKKAVLCEKPVAVNQLQLRNMTQMAMAQNVFFMEAFWSRFNPSICAIKDCIDDGLIGRVNYINADFSFRVDAPVDSRMFRMDLIGGSLLDMGVYPVFLSYFLLGIPQQIMATSHDHEQGTDLQTAMIFRYPDAVSMLYSGFVSQSDMRARICGTEGTIVIDPIWHETQGYTLLKNNEEHHVLLPTLGKGFCHEILECHRCLEDQRMQSPMWSWKQSLELTQILDTVRSKIGLRYPSEALDS